MTGARVKLLLTVAIAMGTALATTATPLGWRQAVGVLVAGWIAWRAFIDESVSREKGMVP